MLFRYSLLVPPNTSEHDPVTKFAQVTYGVLRNVSISFPPGSAALTHVAVRYQEKQIIPLSLGTYLAWDSETIRWDEEIPIFYPPYEFRLVGWSEDDTFPHEIIFRFNILPPRSERAGNLVQRLFGSLASMGEL